MEKYLKDIIDEMSKQLIYLESEGKKKDLYLFNQTLNNYPSVPDVLLFPGHADMAERKMKLENVYSGFTSKKAELLSTMIAAFLFYKQVKKMPDIDSIHNSVMNVKNNFICNKCGKPEKYYYCRFCKKQFTSKDGRRNHKNHCKLNPEPKKKKSKSTQKI